MRKATACTPEGAKVTVDVLKTTDPVSKKDSYANVPDGYNANEEDNVHNCGDGVSISVTASGNITVSPSSFGLDGATITATSGGTTLTVTRIGNSNNYKATGVINGPINVTITDSGYYTASGSS